MSVSDLLEIAFPVRPDYHDPRGSRPLLCCQCSHARSEMFNHMFIQPVWLALVIGAGGFALMATAVWVAVRSRRPGRERACFGCGYSMVGIAGRSCPECGNVGGDEASMYRRRMPRGVIAVLVLVSAGLIVAAIWPASVRVARGVVMPAYITVEEWEAGTLSVRVQEATDPAAMPPRRVRVLHRGRCVYELTTFYPEIYSIDGTPAGRRIMLHPEAPAVMAIMDHSGGSGGHFTMILWSIPESDEPDAQPRLLGVYDDLLLRDVDGDGVAEGLAIEHALAYVLTSNAGSPRPTLVHRWDHWRRTFVFAPELQRARPWTEAEFAGARAAVSGADAEGEARLATLLAMVSERIYGGRADEGLRLFVEAWPGAREELRPALEQFVQAIGRSGYSTLVEMLHQGGAGTASPAAKNEVGQ